MEMREISDRANQFWLKLDELKRGLQPGGFSWYPYESLGSFDHLRELLGDGRGRLLDLAGSSRVLDIGAGDGDVAFFMESLGCNVVAVDCPATNWNGMRGLRLLKDTLGSRVEIRAVDLDSQFTLNEPGGFGLVLLLGVLYHIQNPFYLLSKLARNARYCLLSTRVARFTSSRRLDFHGEPMAYLAGDDEIGSDATNYWIFSEAGLRRILARTGWEICEYGTVGNAAESDPVSAAGDERAYVLAKSKAFRPITLLEGWHGVESSGWRWVERNFSAAFQGTPRQRASVVLRLAVPDALLTGRSLTLSAAINGIALEPEIFTAPGEYTYARPVPDGAARTGELRVDFSLDHALAPDALDQRERGLIVVSVDLE